MAERNQLLWLILATALILAIAAPLSMLCCAAAAALFEVARDACHLEGGCSIEQHRIPVGAGCAIQKRAKGDSVFFGGAADDVFEGMDRQAGVFGMHFELRQGVVFERRRPRKPR